MSDCSCRNCSPCIPGARSLGDCRSAYAIDRLEDSQDFSAYEAAMEEGITIIQIFVLSKRIPKNLK